MSYTQEELQVEWERRNSARPPIKNVDIWRLPDGSFVTEDPNATWLDNHPGKVFLGIVVLSIGIVAALVHFGILK